MRIPYKLFDSVILSLPNVLLRHRGDLYDLWDLGNFQALQVQHLCHLHTTMANIH